MRLKIMLSRVRGFLHSYWRPGQSTATQRLHKKAINSHRVENLINIIYTKHRTNTFLLFTSYPNFLTTIFDCVSSSSLQLTTKQTMFRIWGKNSRVLLVCHYTIYKCISDYVFKQIHSGTRVAIVQHMNLVYIQEEASFGNCIMVVWRSIHHVKKVSQEIFSFMSTSR